MSFHQQLSNGYRPFDCHECGSPYWSKPERVQALTAGGKDPLCRTCQELKGWNPPWPAARRLTDDELAEMQMEVARNELTYESDERTPAVTEPPRSSFPSHSNMEKPLSLGEIQALRMRLKNSLLTSGVTPYVFGRAAGMGTNATATVTRFIEGTGKRATAKPVLEKIQQEMARRGWVNGESSEQAAEQEDTPDLDFEPTMELPEDGIPLPSFDDWGQAMLVHAVMDSTLMDERQKRETLGRLFPDSFPTLA